MSSMKSAQQEQFQERIARVVQKQPGGPKTIKGAAKQVAKQAEQSAAAHQPKPRSILDGPVALIKGLMALVFGVVGLGVSILVGALCLTIGRLVMFHFVGEDMVDDGLAGMLILQYAHLVIAFVLMIILLVMLNLGGGLNFLAACLGGVAMQFAPGLFVAPAPEIWAWLFSPWFVFDAAAQTQRLGMGLDTLMLHLMR